MCLHLNQHCLFQAFPLDDEIIYGHSAMVDIVRIFEHRIIDSLILVATTQYYKEGGCILEKVDQVRHLFLKLVIFCNPLFHKNRHDE